MKRHYAFLSSLLTLGTVTFASTASAQNSPPRPSAEQVLAAASAKQKYTFLAFYKDDERTVQVMGETVQRALAGRSDEAVVIFVDVANPEEKPLVDRLDVRRAPMPLTMAIAPNGAITGVFARKVSAEQISQAFVTPAMARCMKTMQSGKLAVLCVLASPEADVPSGVREFCADPMFKDRATIVTVQSSDPAETEFLRELAGESKTTAAATIALFAPPGALVGTFGSSATKDDFAAALHKAGKCCNDPNCKYNQNSAQAANQGATRK